MKKVVRIIISIFYIIWGITAPLSAIDAVLALDVSALISAASGVIMLLAGIFGLFGIKPILRRVFGIIIFVGAAASLLVSLKTGLDWQPIVTAVMALLYIIW